jgi:hypothetical protein
MEAVCFFQTLVSNHQDKQYYYADDNMNLHCYEKLTFHIWFNMRSVVQNLSKKYCHSNIL